MSRLGTSVTMYILFRETIGTSRAIALTASIVTAVLWNTLESVVDGIWDAVDQTVGNIGITV